MTRLPLYQIYTLCQHRSRPVIYVIYHDSTLYILNIQHTNSTPRVVPRYSQTHIVNLPLPYLLHIEQKKKYVNQRMNKINFEQRVLYLFRSNIPEITSMGKRAKPNGSYFFMTKLNHVLILIVICQNTQQLPIFVPKQF